MSSSLRDLQKWMRWALTDPRGVADALSDPAPKEAEPLSRYARPGDDLLSSIADAPPLSRGERLGIYAEAYFARILEALSEDFRRTRAALGELSFTKLIADYLKYHPSQTPSLGEVGAALPRFAQSHSITRENALLCELAELEWKVIESFYSEDLPRLDPRSLADVPPGEWPQARFELDASVRFLVAHGPLHLFWNEVQNDFDALTETKTRLLVFRHDGRVRVSALDPAPWEALTGMRDGLTLEKICENLARSGENDAPATEWFSGWVQSGVIRKIVLAPTQKSKEE